MRRKNYFIDSTTLRATPEELEKMKRGEIDPVANLLDNRSRKLANKKTSNHQIVLAKFIAHNPKGGFDKYKDWCDLNAIDKDSIYGNKSTFSSNRSKNKG